MNLITVAKDLFSMASGAPARAIEKRISNMGNVMASSNYFDAVHYLYTGEKFPGGLGIDKNYEVVDLRELQRHSINLWRSNPIANMIYNRLETKVINDGLNPDALPEAQILGYSEDDEFIRNWSESLESFIRLYALIPEVVDERMRDNLYELQRQAYSTAKLSGDCLKITRIDPITRLPRIQLIDGYNIGTPLGMIRGINPETGNDVIDGVEINSRGVEVGYWVRIKAFNPNLIYSIEGMNYVFIPAFGPQSGRRVARLIFGSRMRVNEYRGMPLLGCSIQMLKQIDRTLDNSQLAMALDNSLVLSVVTDKDAPKTQSELFGKSPMRRAAIDESTVTTTTTDGNSKNVEFKEIGPGLIIDGLRPGQKIESHNTRHPNPEVMKAVMGGVHLTGAAANVPPEILLLMFNNNFSASRQAVNEFDAIRRKEHSQFNSSFNEPIYRNVVIALDITGRLVTPGLFDAMLRQDDITVMAWLNSNWSSTAELSVDMLKHVTMFEKAFENGLTDRDAISLKYFGVRHSKIVARLTRQNKLLAEAIRPIKELEKQQ